MGVHRAIDQPDLIDYDLRRWVGRPEGEESTIPPYLWWHRCHLDADDRVREGLTGQWMGDYYAYWASCHLEYALMYRATSLHMYYDRGCHLFRTRVYMPTIGIMPCRIRIAHGTPDVAGQLAALWSWPFPDAIVTSTYTRRPSRWAWRWTWVELFPLFFSFRHVLRQLRSRAGICGHRRFGGFRIRYHGTLVDASVVAARVSELRITFVSSSSHDTSEDLEKTPGRIWPAPMHSRLRARR